MHDSEEGQNIGLSYFVERGFRPEIIQKFDLGYCPNKGDAFTQAALAASYKLEYLQTTGLVKTKDERNFDFFRGRVLFPIHSSSGRVLGFGGRTLISDKKVAKYFNSPESPIYHKSDILYGLYFAKGDIIKYDNCFLCEGYTDVISLHQAGLQNVVASSGTALTKEQIRLIRRFTQNITILYDGDSAGIKASFRGIDLILEEGMNVKVVLFPEGEDPDSYAKSHSSQELEDFVKSHSQDFVTFKTEILLKDSKNDPLKKAELIRDVVNSVSLIPDTITRNIYIQEVARLFDISEQIIASEVAKKRAGNSEKSNFRSEPSQQRSNISAGSIQEQTELTSKPSETYSFDEFSLIRVMVKYSVFAISTIHREENEEVEVETSVVELICHELSKDGLSFEFPAFHKIHEIFVDGLKENTLFEPSYFLKNEDQNLVKIVSEIIDDQYELSPNWLAQHKIFTPSERDKIPQLVMDEIYHFKKSKIERRIKIIQSQLEVLDPDDDEKFNDLLSEQVFLDRIKGTLARELNRIIH
jgi:DNA primase